MSRLQWLRGWSVAVGAMDAVTGLWLLWDPSAVLLMLGIAAPPAESWVFLRWIGVFVMSLGLGYGCVLWGRSAGPPVWATTGLARGLVCVFLTAQVILGVLESAWLLVAVADGLVALFQFTGLCAGWWREEKR